jgi:hypothetical protein
MLKPISFRLAIVRSSSRSGAPASAPPSPAGSARMRQFEMRFDSQDLRHLLDGDTLEHRNIVARRSRAVSSAQGGHP